MLDFFKNLVPPGDAYHLGQFAIKKGPNIYGLVFGSGHVRGIDKFLEVAWRKDALNGEADYDINRENIAPTEMLLPLEELKPTKQLVFERDLAGRLERGECRDEAAVIETCMSTACDENMRSRFSSDSKPRGQSRWIFACRTLPDFEHPGRSV